MCTPDVTAIVTLASKATSMFSDVMKEKETEKNYDYRIQMAVNNANLAKNEALKQQQMGIDSSRKEYLDKSRQIAALKAKNAASNLDIYSSTDMFNYNDINDMALNSSQDVKDQYQQKANSYFDKANDYLYQAQDYKNEYKEIKRKQKWARLDSGFTVANKWFESSDDNSSSSSKNKPGPFDVTILESLL